MYKTESRKVVAKTGVWGNRGSLVKGKGYKLSSIR